MFLSFRITWYLKCKEIVIYQCMKWHENSSRCNLPGNDHLAWKLDFGRWLSLGASQPSMS